jgi:hypothetical protein
MQSTVTIVTSLSSLATVRVRIPPVLTSCHLLPLPNTTTKQSFLNPSMVKWPQRHLVNRHDVSQPHAQVLADDLVHANLGLFRGVVSEHDANRVLALLALHARKTD